MSDTTQRIKSLVLQDLTYQEMCRTLNLEGHSTPEGHAWTPMVLLVKIHQLRHDLTPVSTGRVQILRQVIA